jgi:NADPH2 dehydrogenase
MSNYTKVAQIRTPAALKARLAELGWELPIDERILTAEENSPLAEPLRVGRHQVGNRWCIHPMEGWDAEPDGSPSELTRRRWSHFGLSGAKWIWGGEAAAVQEDGRANPRQTLAMPKNRKGLARLLAELRTAHLARFGCDEDLYVGLQLTHSGRFSRPRSARLEPRIAYHHPLLDEKFGIDPDDTSVVWRDEELERLIDRYVDAARTAHEVGFSFVDVKACHGYLVHEFLSARRRPGKFGGDLAGRTRLLRTIIERIRDEIPQLEVAVRLSCFDTPPYRTSREVGQPMNYQTLLPYDCGFGLRPEDPLEMDLEEPLQLLRDLRAAGVVAVNVSCGSPYYNPHVQRPAIFPPSDGYLPPEDPLVGVARQILAARRCKQEFPDWPLVGTGYSYLQEFLPQVAQAVVREGWIDAVGLGRMVLSYPELPADCLQRGRLERKRICRTFSDCTTAPRMGLISGCYPLDPFYKSRPEADQLREGKSRLSSDEVASVAEKPSSPSPLPPTST